MLPSKVHKNWKRKGSKKHRHRDMGAEGRERRGGGGVGEGDALVSLESCEVASRRGGPNGPQTWSEEKCDHITNSDTLPFTASRGVLVCGGRHD